MQATLRGGLSISNLGDANFFVMPKAQLPPSGQEAFGVAVLEKGKEYRIPDAECPPLSQEECKEAFSLVVSCIEHGGRVPPLLGTYLFPTSSKNQLL